MPVIQEPLYIGGVLCALILLSVWLASKKVLKFLGVPIIVILLAAIASNMGVIPSAASGNALYSGIFTYLAPIGIFILMLEVDLKSIREAGGPMLMMFLIGTLATICGTLAAWWIVKPASIIGTDAHAVAGMYAATYIGGSINLNAVAIHYGVTNNGQLFAAVNVVDNLIGTIWIMATIIIPRWLQKLRPRKHLHRPGTTFDFATHHNERIDVMSLAVIGALGLLTVSFSNWLGKTVPSIPAVITITTIALAFAQMRFVKKIKGIHTIGLFVIFIFLAAVGTLCDVRTLVNTGSVAVALLVFVVILVLVHGLIIFGVGALLKQDWDIIAIASQANIGGNTTAIATAESLERPDLLLPGMLAGSLGNAIGTYAGLLIAGFLSA